MLTNEETIHLEKILSDNKDLFEKIQKDQKDLESYILQKQKYKKNQMEGIKKAKENGIVFGRPKVILDKKEFDSIAMLFENNQISSRQAAKALNISQTTFIRRYQDYEKKKEMK